MSELESGKAFQIASKFCFPRLSGTQGEVEAQKIAKRLFENIGLKPIEDEFQASYLMINLFARIALFPFGLFLLLAGIFYQHRNPFLSLSFFLLGLSFGLGFALYCQSSPKFLGWRKKHWTKNIFACAGSENAKQNVLVVAHYDSKSQIFPGWLRVLVYYLGGFFSLAISLLGIYLCFDLWKNQVFHRLGLEATIFTGLVDFLPLFNRTANHSPGAVDNAGALGVVFELARIFKEKPLKHTRLWLVLTGAEELGLIGAREFVEKHQAELDPQKTFVINLDGLGSGYKICALSRLGFPGKKTSSQLNHLLYQISERRALRFKMIRASIGFSTDAYHFLKKGYQTISIGCLSKYVHTPEDSVEKLISQNLDDYLDVLIELIAHLDKKQ